MAVDIDEFQDKGSWIKVFFQNWGREGRFAEVRLLKRGCMVLTPSLQRVPYWSHSYLQDPEGF